MLAGRWAAPALDPTTTEPLALGGLSVVRPLVLDLPAGALDPGRLAATLSRSGRPPLWVRLTPYDLDQATFDALAGVVLDAAGRWEPGTPTVVESDSRNRAERFLSRLVIAEPGTLAAGTVLLPAAAPRNDRRLATAAGHVTPGSDPLDQLTAGRPALRRSVLATAPLLRPGELDELVRTARRYDELTRVLAARLLHDLPPTTRALLGFVALLGFGHSRYASLAPALEASARLPWWTDCAGGWRWLQPVWREALHAACRTDGHPDVVLLGRVLAELTADGAGDAAVELCLDACCPGIASDLLAGSGADLLAADRPLALRRWLRRLPRATRCRRRELAVQLRATHRASRRPLAPVPPPPARTQPAGTQPAGTQPAGTQPAVRPSVRVALPDGAGPATSTVPTLDARLLGPLEMSLGGRRVEVWHGRKGAMLLAYLLLHRDRTTSRDALAVEFWPDAAPAASRNRLHVAMHALRADLHRVGSVPVVLFDRGYRVNPELRVRLDTEAFDGAIGLGGRAEDSADPGTALVAYQRAVDCYRGDLLADFPYEDWTLLPRQHYRVRLLDALGRGAHLAFEAGRYDESAAYAQRLLRLDFFREDLHRLLMRSYCRLGRPHLALRQFDECSRQLVQELGIRPATETVDLYRQVRERASV